MARRRRRRLKLGKPLNVTAQLSDVLRFFSKVQESPDLSWDGVPCWLWTAHTDENGYGQFKFRGRARWAHRFAWELFHTQSLPDGDDVDHLCHDTACVNPRHLMPATRGNNSARNQKPKPEVPF